MRKWKLYFADNYHSASPSAVWDSFKLYARSTFVSPNNKLKATSVAAFDKAVSELSCAERQYVTNPSLAEAASLKMQTRVVEKLQYEMAR